LDVPAGDRRTRSGQPGHSERIPKRAGTVYWVHAALDPRLAVYILFDFPAAGLAAEGVARGFGVHPAVHRSLMPWTQPPLSRRSGESDLFGAGCVRGAALRLADAGGSAIF